MCPFKRVVVTTALLNITKYTKFIFKFIISLIKDERQNCCQGNAAAVLFQFISVYKYYMTNTTGKIYIQYAMHKPVKYKMEGVYYFLSNRCHCISFSTLNTKKNKYYTLLPFASTFRKTKYSSYDRSNIFGF